MEFNNIKEYYTDFIKQYLPYKNSNTYNKFIDFFSNVYLNKLYCDVPYTLKELYEQNTIPSEVYNNILYAIGLNKDIIEQLSLKDKALFLYNLSDFERYKGTVKLFKKIADTFNDKLNIYEFYVGEDDVGDWILKPKLIYQGSTIQDQIKIPFYYNDVYYSIPSLLIPIDNLVHMKLESTTAFPLKTNMLLLEYDFTCDADILINIIISSILRDYGTLNVSLYMKDNIYQLKLLDVYYLWFYIISKTFNIKRSYNMMSVPRFSYRNAYHITELDKICYEYNSIKTTNDIQKFYEKYIAKKTGAIHSKEENKTTMSEVMKNISIDLYEYLETRLFYMTEKPQLLYEANRVLNEIYGSLMILEDDSTDINFSNYFKEFLKNLPIITYVPENTTSYSLFYNLKPYHVELITRANNSIRPKDIITQDDTYTFTMEMVRTEFISELEDVHSFEISIPKYDNINLTENVTFKITDNNKIMIRDIILSDVDFLYNNNNELLLTNYEEDTI